MSDSTTRRREAAAAGFAAAASAGVYCLATALRGGQPFGPPVPGRLTDVTVPLHAHLSDLLHGATTGDLLFTWNSGFGAPFLPDVLTGLGNPFSWPAALLPASCAAVSVLVAGLLTIALAAALMTYALGRLHPGPAPLRALLAIGYGLCAWVPAEGAANPVRLWGLVSLPLLLLAGDWCLHERRWAPGTLCVAAAWSLSTHTAAMATLAAGLVLLIRLVAAGPALPGRTGRARVRVIGRAVTMAAVGVLAASPVLFVLVTAVRDAQPALLGPEATPGPVAELARLLPGSPPRPPLPAVAVGVPALLLAASLPFNRRVRARERVAWCTLPAVAGVSLVWKPEVLIWHGPALPVGGPARVAFVLGGLLVAAAWVSLSHRPRPPALLGGACLVLLLALSAGSEDALGTAGRLWLAGGGALVLAALWALERLHTRRRASALVTAALACVVLGGALRSLDAEAGPTGTGPDRAAAQAAARRAVRAAADWPRSRSDPGPHAFTANDPLLLDGEGGGYASDTLPAATAEALHGLGAGWTLGGRRTFSPEDPVGRALFAVGGRLDDGPPPDGFTPRRAPAPPLVTVHPAGPPDTSTVWSRREALLGGSVYDVPVLAPAGGPAAQPHGSSGWSVPATPAGAAATTLAGSCTPGSTAYFHGLWFNGTVTGLGTTYAVGGSQPATAGAVHLLGTVPADGRVEVLLRTAATGQIPARPVGCLRAADLAAALARLTATGARTITAGGHGLAAVLPAGSTGTAVLSVPAVRGWVCSAGGGRYAPAEPYLGLVSVPLGAGADRVSCSYRVPGLAAGAVLGLAAVGVIALVAVTHWPRRRPARRVRATGG
ncbi:YfhO family protein [Kitasatospora sp. NBC_00315]|uniref:YfhO family protein n=1 Tax=Kitasatospora sp. NBC_00315 TaxID=2975963 RepID=UPI003251D08D